MPGGSQSPGATAGAHDDAPENPPWQTPCQSTCIDAQALHATAARVRQRMQQSHELGRSAGAPIFFLCPDRTHSGKLAHGGAQLRRAIHRSDFGLGELRHDGKVGRERGGFYGRERESPSEEQGWSRGRSAFCGPPLRRTRHGSFWGGRRSDNQTPPVSAWASARRSGSVSWAGGEGNRPN